MSLFKKIFSACLCVSMIMANTTPIVDSAFTVSAEQTNEVTSTKTYIEMLEMTNEAFCGIYGSYYAEYGLGDDSISDEEKFNRLFPDIDDGYGVVLTPQNEWRKMFIDGKETAYMRFSVNEEVGLNRLVTAVDFGFPAEWEIEAFDGVIMYDTTPEARKNVHEYRVYVPAEVFSDFESYVRMDMAGSIIADNVNMYGIEVYLSPITLGNASGDWECVPIVDGDIDVNGSLDVSDAVLLARLIAEDTTAQVSPIGLTYTDVDKDGFVTSADLTVLLRILAKMR